MFCDALEGIAKPFENLMFLKDFTAGPRRNTLDPMGAFASLRNHCQQQLVALCTPVPLPGRGKVRPVGTDQLVLNFG